jgi:vitamin B12/bleomycin/antimicrobial peptide transport system ATP-binding/permease protein
MSLGGVVQVAAAFIQVQIAFNWVVENFMRIAEWLASARRVMDLVEAIDRLESESGARTGEVIPVQDIEPTASQARQGE